MSLKIIRIAIIVLALLVGGTIFLVTSIKQKAEYNAPRARLETVTADELREGIIIGAVMTALGLTGTVIFVVKFIKARRGY